MKIMFSVGTYWPSKDGVSQVTGYLAEGLARRGHEVLVLTGADNGNSQGFSCEEVHNDVKIERMRIEIRWPLSITGKDSESTPRFYRNRIRDYQPDILIVVCAQTWTLDWLSPYLSAVECPIIFYCHGYSAWCPKYPIREELLKRNVLGAWIEYKKKRYFENLYKTVEKFDLALYLSESNSGYLYAKKYGLSNGKVLKNAVEDVFFEEQMQHMKSYDKAEDICFLSVANYNDNKDQSMLLNAFAKASVGRTQLLFAGSEKNDYYEMLCRHREECLQGQDDKKVQMYIGLSREEIYGLYQKADVFICSSKSEQSSVVVREAAAAGLPVITTDVGNAQEIEGALVVSNEEEMRSAIETMYYDREQRRTRGLALKQWILDQGCRIDDKVDTLESEINRLLS